MDTEPGQDIFEQRGISVRAMRQEDGEVLVGIDATASGNPRPEYFKLMMERALERSTMQISLVAEIDGNVVGFVIGSLYYGEFGQLEPAAAIDAIGVHVDFKNIGVGSALMAQIRRNLGALQISNVRTEVEWDDLELLGFFQAEEFRLSSRLCLELKLDPSRMRS